MDSASDSGYTVNGILFDRGGDDKIYIDGTSAEYDEDADGVVQAYNPFAAVGIAEYAWTQLGGLNYSAVSLEMPAENILEPGDVFTIKTSDGAEKTAIVMEQTLSASCTGGFVESISCTAESKNQTRNAENRAEATEKTAEEAITDRTAEKLQTSGSDYYAMTGSTGFYVCHKGSERYQEIICYIQENPSDKDMLKIGDTAGNGILFLKDNTGFQIESRDNYLTVGGNGSSVLNFHSNGTYFSIKPKANVQLNSDGISMYSEILGGLITIEFRSDGALHVISGTNELKMAYDGLYYNGSKVMTE